MSCHDEDRDKIYLGDWGTAIILDTEEDLADATAVSIEVMKPNRSMTTVTGEKIDTTKIRYILTSSEAAFDQAGEYRLQAKVVMPTGVWYGATTRMTIYKRFQ